MNGCQIWLQEVSKVSSFTHPWLGVIHLLVFSLSFFHFLHLICRPCYVLQDRSTPTQWMSPMGVDFSYWEKKQAFLLKTPKCIWHRHFDVAPRASWKQICVHMAEGHVHLLSSLAQEPGWSGAMRKSCDVPRAIRVALIFIFRENVGDLNPQPFHRWNDGQTCLFL